MKFHFQRVAELKVILKLRLKINALVSKLIN